MRKTFFIIICIILSIALARNILVKILIEYGVFQATGCQFQATVVNTDLIRTTIEVRKAKLLNPQGFPDKIMIDVPEIYADFDLHEIFKGLLHFSELSISIEELTVIKMDAETTNIGFIKSVRQKRLDLLSEEEKKKRLNFLIDTFNLSIDTVISKNYSGNRKEATVNRFKVDLHESFENIKSFDSVIFLVIVKGFTKTAVDRLLSLDIGILRDATSGILSKVKSVVKKTGSVITEGSQKTKDAPQKTVKDISGVTKKAVEKTGQGIEKVKEELEAVAQIAD